MSTKIFSTSGEEIVIGERVLPYLGITVEQLILFLYPTLLIPVVALWWCDLQSRRRRQTQPQGCHKLGMTGKSNVSDEYEAKYDEGVPQGKDEAGTSTWRVKALFIHPIKSCGSVELESVEIEGAGMKWDRKFAFAELLTPTSKPGMTEAEKKPKWTFRTLRQPGYERLIHVKPEIWIPGENAPSSTKATGGYMVVKFPYIPSGFLAPLDRLMMTLGLISTESSFTVPLVPPPKHGYPVEDVQIWKDTPTWINYGKHVPEELKRYLNVKNPLTLFRVDPNSYREVFRCAPRKEQVGYQPVVGFADAYPLHLLNLASVHDVGNRIKDQIPALSARRFRGNFLSVGPKAYDEDDWKKIRIGKHELFCACHTIRCRLPNVDPDTSERHPSEPDKMLKSFRCIDDGDPLNAALGLQMVPATDETITANVGDEIEVLERGVHRYMKQ